MHDILKRRTRSQIKRKKKTGERSRARLIPNSIDSRQDLRFDQVSYVTLENVERQSLVLVGRVLESNLVDADEARSRNRVLTRVVDGGARPLR